MKTNFILKKEHFSYSYIEMTAYKNLIKLADSKIQNIGKTIKKFIQTIYQNLNNNINFLLQKQINNKQTIPEQSNFQFHEPIKNLTDIKFSNIELDHLLCEGFKTNFHFNTKFQLNNS